MPMPFSVAKPRSLFQEICDPEIQPLAIVTCQTQCYNGPDHGENLNRETWLAALSERNRAIGSGRIEVKNQEHSHYYIARKPELLAGFEEMAQQWATILGRRYGKSFTRRVLEEAREEFEALLPGLPYIGGGENHLTSSLIGSVQCLALYRVMKGHGRSAADTGSILYDAVKVHAEKYVTRIPPSQQLSREALMERRRARARRSQERQYAWDWVYTFVEGDGERFDYGYDFTECATEKFYRAQGAQEFLPFYCFLDFPKCELGGLGLSRTMTLGEGDSKCDFRFKEGGKSTQDWPPPFLKGD